MSGTGGKVLRFPRRQEPNPFLVYCRRTERWVEFPFRADPGPGGSEVLYLRVRTAGKDGQPRTLCELYLLKEDVLRALAHVGPPVE